MGGYFAVLNASWTGYFKDTPILDIRNALVPYDIEDLKTLHTDTFKNEENVTSAKVCFVKQKFEFLVVMLIVHHFNCPI
jgi:hypothetical protein